GPAWTPGKPAPLAEEVTHELHKEVSAALQDAGYFFSDVVVSATPEKDGTVTARIEIRDEGPPGVLGEVIVVGAERNTRQDAIDFRKLRPGMGIDFASVRRLEQKLWRSARFAKHKVTPVVPLDRASNTVNLKIELDEVDLVPPLREHLSREQQVMLKLR